MGAFLERLAIAAGTVLVATLVVAASAPVPGEVEADGRAAESARLRELGLRAGYNLDHEEAMQRFREAAAANPDDPAPHRMMAATLWINSLFMNGAVTIEDYLGQARTSAKRRPPSPDLDRAFRDHIKRAQVLADERVRRNPRDADARFQAGAAHSFLASYIATVEGRGLAGLGAARRAYNEHERVLQLDPGRKDAGMVVGMYRYGVSTLPLHWRLLAGLAGFGGGRERGLRLVEEAAAYPSDVQTNAMFTLVLIYNRERRYDDALRVVKALQERYPRNRLLRLEEASTLLRASRADAARKAIEDGLAMLAADARPRAFGEVARWRYAYGSALVGLGLADRAERELRAVLQAGAHQWLEARAHKELGKIADLAGNRPRALAEYRLAVHLARAEDDADCAEEAAALLKAPYRQR